MTLIRKLHIYRNDVVVERKPLKGNVISPDCDRGDVTEFSYRSRRRLAFVAANTDVDFRTMVTLTYPSEYPMNGRESKRHLNTFLTRLRKRIKPDKLSYLWFLEFQARGAPHYHILTSHWVAKNWVAVAWYEIVGSDDERHLRAGTRTERIRSQNGARNYAVKYAMKMYQKHAPAEFSAVGRFWGCSRDVKPVSNKQVWIKDGQMVEQLLSGWTYGDRQTAEDHKVLFGAADAVRRAIGEKDE